MFGVIKRNPTLSPKDLFRLLLTLGGHSSLPESSVFSYTGYARFALYNLLRLLKLERGSEILLPAYVCDVVLLPFAEIGLIPVYYGVTDQFQIDFGTVRTTSKTKAIITINYFGMSQAFDSIAAFVKNQELIWINDNSHGFASSHGMRTFESFGDFSITSFRKVLPTINGARACINNEAYEFMRTELSELNRPDAAEHKLLRFFGATLFGNLHYRPWRHPDYSVLSASSESDIMPFQLDRMSGGVLRMTIEGQIQKRRFSLYQAIDSFLAKSRYRFLESIPGLLQPGNSPMAYPVIIQDPECWRAVLRVSRDVGMNIHTWPDLPQEVIAANVFGAVDRWRQLLLLPIHQDIHAERYCSSLAGILDAV